MSITNIISNDEVTLVQGVDGLFFCEESWITQSRAASRSEEAFPEEVIEIKNEGISMEQLQINPEKPDVPLNKNDAFQKVQKRRVQEKR